jgi:hypothetical protein
MLDNRSMKKLSNSRINLWLATVTVASVAFTIGRWSAPNPIVRADASTPQIEVRPVGGDSSLVVYYPNMNKVYVYQNPFIGMPKWGCAYSLQLSAPGGPVERQQCPLFQ